MGVTLESAFEAIVGIIMLSGLIAFGLPIGIGFLVNATLGNATEHPILTGIASIISSLAPFIAGIIGVYLLFTYAMGAMKKA